MVKMNRAILLVALLLVSSPCVVGRLKGGNRCTFKEELTVIDLPFNAAFTTIDGDDLYVTSFFNVKFDPGPIPLERDLVAKIDISNIEDAGEVGEPEELTDLVLMGPPKTIWPNEALLVPEGVFPFKALLVAQGFHPAPFQGRLTVINLDDPQKQEYVIDQSTQTGPFDFTNPLDPTNDPAFYHNAVFFDMDNDGHVDIITVRSGFRVGSSGFHPPSGELVWFRNPGDALDATVEWDETVLYGGDLAMMDVNGPDIFVQMYDFENDGIPEFVATHFFTGGDFEDSDNGKYTIYGAPEGQGWGVVDAYNPAAPRPRMKDIATNQGKPFGLKIVDLNGDGLVDILGTNHQPDNSDEFPSNIAGRVFGIEQPEGSIFDNDWTTHVFLDDIRPQPSLAGAQASRLAPGDADVFYVDTNPNKALKPWIVVGGDEAGKVWLLRPEKEDFLYHEEVLFDINDYYGPGTTQTTLEDRPGISISTIGKVTVLPSELDENSFLVFIPVFEAQDIHVLRLTVKPRVKCDSKCDSESSSSLPPAALTVTNNNVLAALRVSS